MGQAVSIWLGVVSIVFVTRVSAATPADTLEIGNRPPPPCEDAHTDVFRAGWVPERSVDAMTGSEFAEKTKGWAGRDRQEAAIAELLSGNIPPFLRSLKPIRLSHTFPRGRIVHAVVWVAPDYLSIGSNEDFLRIPMTRPSAVIVARELGFVLPTRRIVDAITKQAELRLKPQPLPPGREMRSSEYYLEHHALIEEQRKGHLLGELVVGHKKDVVITNRLRGRKRIAIYGWPRRDGRHIQGLSTVHDARYADYSHGVRFVYEIVCVDGEVRSIYDVLQDPQIAPVFTYEGLIPRVRAMMRW